MRLESAVGGDAALAGATPALRRRSPRGSGCGPYAHDVLDGFDEMYRLLCEHRETLLAPRGPLSCFSEDRTRVVLRPTHDYYSCTAKAAIPNCCATRSHATSISIVCGLGFEHHPTREHLVGYEREDLWWGGALPSSRRVPRRVRSGPAAVTRLSTTSKSPGCRWSSAGSAAWERPTSCARSGSLGRARHGSHCCATSQRPGAAASGGAQAARREHAVRGGARRRGSGSSRFCALRWGHASWIGETPAGEGGSAMRALGPESLLGAVRCGALPGLDGDA